PSKQYERSLAISPHAPLEKGEDVGIIEVAGFLERLLKVGHRCFRKGPQGVQPVQSSVAVHRILASVKDKDPGLLAQGLNGPCPVNLDGVFLSRRRSQLTLAEGQGRGSDLKG